MGVTAIVGAAAGLLGAKSAKKAGEAQAQAIGAAGAQAAESSEYAAELQYKASQEALALQREQYENDIRMLTPYLQGGAESYGRAQALLAAGPPVVTYGGASGYSPTGGKYIAPGQVSAGQFVPSSPDEETANRIADLEGQIAKYEASIAAQQAASQAFMPQLFADRYGNVFVGTGSNDSYIRQFNQLVNGAQPSQQTPQMQGDLAKASAELQAIRDQEAQRVASERQAFDRSVNLTDAYNRGLQAVTGPQSIEYTQSPGYQFRLDEGMKAIERGAAARGRVDSGETMKALQQYGQSLAAQDFENFEQKRKADYYNYLAALSGQSGQAAASQAANLGSSSAAGAANIIGQGASALAQGYAQAGQQRASGFANQAIAQAQAGNIYNQDIYRGIGQLFGQGKEKGWF